MDLAGQSLTFTYMLCYETQGLSGWPVTAKGDRGMERQLSRQHGWDPPWPARPDVGEQRQNGHGRGDELGLPHNPGHRLRVDGVHRKDERRQQPLRLLPIRGRIPWATSCINNHAQIKSCMPCAALPPSHASRKDSQSAVWELQIDFIVTGAESLLLYSRCMPGVVLSP